MLEFYHNFLKKVLRRWNSVEFEIDTESFYLAFSEGNLEDVILTEISDERNEKRSKNCTGTFIANATEIFPRMLQQTN